MNPGMRHKAAFVLGWLLGGCAAGSGIYPDPPVEGETVNFHGQPLDPEMRACYRKTALFIDASQSADRIYEICWCKSKGYTWIHYDGSCKA